MSDRRVEVILAFGTYRVGQILEPYGAHRQMLIQRGYVKPFVEHVESPPVVECAAAAVDSPSTLPVVPSATGEHIQTLEKPRKKHVR